MSCRKGWYAGFYGLLTACLFMLNISPAWAQANPRSVRVGVYQNEPKVFIDENGQASGIFMDLLAEMAAAEGWGLVYTPCEWADCLSALEAGEIDLMPDVAYSPERDLKYDFHETPVIESWSVVYTAPGFTANKLSQLDGKRVAILTGSIQQTAFEQIMKGFGFQTTIIPAVSSLQAFELARDGQADAAIASHFFGDYFHQEYGLKKTAIVFSPTTLYYATAEGRNHDLLQAIDRHLEQWLQQPNSAYYTALNRWTEKEPPSQLPQYVLWITGGVLGLLIAATGMIILLRRQVATRTRRLELAGAELQKSEQRYQTLASISPVGIFRAEVNGATSYVNPKWCEITGLPAEQALGFGWLAAVHPDDREKLSQGWQKSTQAQQPSFSDYRFLRPDGTVAWVMGQATPEFNAENQVAGYVGTITDITDRVNAEYELRRLNSELEERVDQRTAELEVAMLRALEADRLKSAFLASMSHELRTPLNSIIGFTGVLQQGLAGPLNTEQAKQLGMVRESARHLLALINDVLDISKIEAGQLEVACAPFEVRTAIESSMSSVIPLAQKKALDLNATIASNVGVVVSDRRRVEQILLNLLSNAIKFTEQGEVRLNCRVDGPWLEIAVSDSGMGIHPEDLGKLFQPFRQLETGLNRRHEGTGLGLAICNNLAALLGGRIHARSEWGKGSTFTLVLPLTIAGEDHGKHSDH